MRKCFTLIGTAAIVACLNHMTPAAAQTPDVGAQRLAEAKKVCLERNRAFSPNDAEAARYLADLSTSDYTRLVATCAQLAGGNTEDSAEVVVASAGGSPCNASVSHDFNQVRACLQHMPGPKWVPDPRMPHFNSYKNRAAPPDAVPCQPAGFDHVVLCAPHPIN